MSDVSTDGPANVTRMMLNGNLTARSICAKHSPRSSTARSPVGHTSNWYNMRDISLKVGAETRMQSAETRKHTAADDDDVDVPLHIRTEASTLSNVYHMLQDR